jgi:hypothetical protein
MRDISIKEILTFLDNGVTRTTDSVGYDPSLGSIEEKYSLTKAQVRDMFQHALLKNKKTKPAASFRLVDDVTVKSTTPTSTTPSYGARPASSSPSIPEVEVDLTTAENRPQEPVVEEVISQSNGESPQDSLA